MDSTQNNPKEGTMKYASISATIKSVPSYNAAGLAFKAAVDKTMAAANKPNSATK